MNKISIIIPVLNEEENIPQLLHHLKAQSTTNIIENIIIVDGGSQDKSVLAAKKEGVTVLESNKGRAKQMNLGAKHAKGKILYFLHVDSFPPKNFDQYIINEINKGNEAGCFRLKFNHNHWWLRLASWLTQFSWRACRGGDQSQFITKTLFNDIGGFDESYNIYEDNILINELYKRKQFTVINKKIVTSARRYKEHGIWKLQYHFWAIYVKRWLGASSNELYDYYKKYIA